MLFSLLVYIYTARLIIEHPREWLASLADKLEYVKRGSTTFKVLKDGCGVPSAARALLGPEGLLMR